ncbi:hypothetical protein BVRB_2g045520 [Beta vulgaris subsp. vulgaris]|uniref:Uncharacterized protein n=1 Tax=Beta vulgaris subsp. vulgaris TaxID=3555 RepID=A0A0J8BH98_BETVV|nr:hypothetical protein BVRB_2g045520 [Beta vulgaris subsp. vulgaris]
MCSPEERETESKEYIYGLIQPKPFIDTQFCGIYIK